MRGSERKKSLQKNYFGIGSIHKPVPVCDCQSDPLRRCCRVPQGPLYIPEKASVTPLVGGASGTTRLRYPSGTTRLPLYPVTKFLCVVTPAINIRPYRKLGAVDTSAPWVCESNISLIRQMTCYHSGSLLRCNACGPSPSLIGAKKALCTLHASPT
jgi:hypothetical protein